jgi:muramidase (phage lysozyme)
LSPTALASGVLAGCLAYAWWVRQTPAGAIAGEGDEPPVWLDAVSDFFGTWNVTNAEALGHPNMQAFLSLIRQGEGTAGANGYRTLVGGGLFSGYEDHPRQKVYIPSIGEYSTAAGAYQILERTWDWVKLAAGLPDFSPASQDLAAIQLIRRRGALADVLAGNLRGALEKCSWEWASLPPWRYAKQGTLTTDRAQALFAQFGGTSAYV